MGDAYDSCAVYLENKQANIERPKQLICSTVLLNISIQRQIKIIYSTGP